jgi:hypothetical protein
VARADADPRTSFKILAEHLAKDFATYMRGVKIAATGEPYSVDLTIPDGPSTAGGKQAAQHVRLVPSAAGQAVIIVATANPLDQTIEIRAYEHVEANHKERFKNAFPIAREAYTDLVSRLIAFFTRRGMSVSVVNTAESNAIKTAATQPKAERKQAFKGALLGGVVLVVLAIITGFVLLK